MGAFGDFLRRINPFDGVPASAFNVTKNAVVGSLVYAYKGVNYIVKSTSWTDALLAYLQPLNIVPGQALKDAQIGQFFKIVASNGLTIDQTTTGLDFVAGWVGARKVFFSYVPDYNRPDLSIRYLGELLGIPTDTLKGIVGYSVGRQGQKNWLNGCLTIMTTNHIGIKNYLYDIESDLEFIASGKRITVRNLATMTTPDPNINPATGQPWGFGSVDLTNGEVTQDGVVIKTAQTFTPTGNFPKVPETTTTNGLKVFGIVALGIVIYKRTKKKNR